jgi:dTDP-4-amino-4,6-dideoxygalactose transaminase
MNAVDSALPTPNIGITSMPEIQIPFNKPALLGKEFDYVREAIEHGKISGDGHFTKLCQNLLRRITGAESVLLTTSCTHALEMAALLLDIQPGDEVLMPSFTFVSTANAFVLRGARPVFIDSRPDTLNLDETRIESLVTPRTKAILPVHYAGVGCDMDYISKIANARGLAVVEDNAHGLFGKYRGRDLGSFGCMATQSFHETKNISCGEGGALVINDPRYAHRAEILREKGTNRAAFFRGQVDKYTWVDVGSSYVPSDVLAAFLYAQLEQAERIQQTRRAIWLRYQLELTDWAANNDIRLPEIPTDCEQAYHMFYLLMPTLEDRQEFIEHLRHRGILAVFHYVPLHLSPMGQKFGGRPGDCPVVEDLSDRLVRLPFYFDLSEIDQQRVIDAVQSFQPAGSRGLKNLHRALQKTGAPSPAYQNSTAP